MERKNIARKGSIIGFISIATNLSISFFSRKVLLSTLGLEYVGLYSTLSQLLGMLALSELGVETVVLFKLYQAVSREDHNRICDIMNVFRCIYKLIALVIVLSGVIVIPLLRFIITDIGIQWGTIYIAWGMMVISSAASYLLSYNRALIYADQKQYIVTAVNTVLHTFFFTSNIILLVIWHNFYLFISINILYTIATNCSLFVLRKRLYPWFEVQKVNKKLYKEIFLSVKEVIAGKVCGYVFNSTDNLVISSLIGTSIVGIFMNYATVISSIKNIIYAVVGPIQALIGNYLLRSEKKDIEKFFMNYTYIVYVLICILLIPTSGLMDDFIILFFGREYQIDRVIEILFIVEAYVALIQISSGNMVEVSGLFKEQKQFYFVASIINIFLSVAGAYLIGLSGVIIGTIIGNLYCWYKRVYYVYNNIIEKAKGNFRIYLAYNIKMIIIFAMQYIMARFIHAVFLNEISMLSFFIKGCILVFFAIIIQCICFGRTKEFQYLFELTKINRIKMLKLLRVTRPEKILGGKK